VFIASNSFVSPDPTTFSDLSISNVHEERRLTVADQVLGTGLFNLKDALYVSSGFSSLIAIPTFGTTASGAQNVTAATYTTPNAIANMRRAFKVSVVGGLVWGETASTEGGTLTLRNSTTSTDLASTFVTSTGNANTNGTSRGSGVSLLFRTGLINPNTTLILTLTRWNAGSNVTLYNGYMLIEEYN
jgi:hypothetical protein